MPSIRQNAYPDVLPDFRNLAVMARVLVAVNGLALAGALYASSAFGPGFERFMYAAAFLEPLLLMELTVLFAASAARARLRYSRTSICTPRRFRRRLPRHGCRPCRRGSARTSCSTA